jgi:hypothetical protein
MLAGELALTIAGAFTGAAIYINIVEQPAQLQLDDSSLLVEWKLAYRWGILHAGRSALGLIATVVFLSAGQ